MCPQIINKTNFSKNF